MSSHLGEIFLTDHGCHVLFFWNLTSQTLRSSLETFSPVSADEEIEGPRSKASWQRSHSKFIGRGKASDFPWSCFSQCKNAVSFTSFRLLLTVDWRFQKNCYSFSLWTQGLFLQPLILPTWIGKSSVKTGECKSLQWCPVMLPYALTLLGKSYNECYGE